MSFSLYHIVREPKVKKDKNPVLILLHGYGSNEEDLFSFASELPEEYYVISVRAPYDLMYNSYAWYAINFDADENKFSDIPEAQNSRDLIAKFIDEVIVNYAVDKDNVTLIGFSQGCILSYAVALSYSQKVQRVVAMSGYLNTEIATDDYYKNDFSKLRIFASHGTVDQVIPVDWARNSIPKLKLLGIDVAFKEYPVGHGVAPQNFFDFKNWLQA
ncbi:alpha/beta hydrolase [Flavobacterium capsici]|uniref:Alpha/beta fold hydrolase n=1 Tax=Flavobacterium capsici TaxID=3075618 RepID=A0AA96F1Y0_9FLAO|nr:MULTISPECIES: alpha/beta fold hydrolase [unclassified Flavobacterium]WNM18092.1 alpha/beta fold hydrolase [Flavobacterium sp. PMR2A8]WNM22144.1 alpha/beta fold hydrolase [Flavobacterium sp. PMTSA4]